MTTSLLRQPRWIVSHVLILVVSVVFVRLGVWQLDRLSQVREENARLEARLAEPPLAFGRLADLGAGDAAVDDLEYRRIEVTGVYRTDEEVLQRSRAHRGQNGFHVLTPLQVDDDLSVLVRRGWVPFELDTPPVAEATPPAGTVRVTGYLERSEEQPGFGQTDPPDGVLPRVFRSDVGRIGAQVDTPLFPMVLHLESQSPAQPDRLPVPAERPDLDEANHLSYALQWFSFALIALVGYAAVLRKRTREHAGDSAGEGAAPTPFVDGSPRYPGVNRQRNRLPQGGGGRTGGRVPHTAGWRSWTPTSEPTCSPPLRGRTA